MTNWGKPNLSTSCYHCRKQVSRAPLRLPFLQKHLKGSFTSSFTKRKKHSTPYANHLRFPKDMQESTHPQNRKQHQQTCKGQSQAFIWQHCFQAQGTISKNLSQKQNLKLFPIIPVQVQNCLVPTVIKVRSWPFACTGLCMKQIAILWFRA